MLDSEMSWCHRDTNLEQDTVYRIVDLMGLKLLILPSIDRYFNFMKIRIVLKVKSQKSDDRLSVKRN